MDVRGHLTQHPGYPQVLDDEDVGAAFGDLPELPEEGGKRRYRAKLRLTEAGRAAAERMTGKIRQAVQRGGRGLTDGQREDFYRALGVIARNLEQICSTEEPI